MVIKSLLVTSDRIGSSGATVTGYEYKALKSLGEAEVLNPEPMADPFETDQIAVNLYKRLNKKFDLVHFYAGTYSKLIDLIKSDGSKVTYTAAAHDINESRDEHLILGYAYDYKHLTDPGLFNEYVRGYKSADVVICPSHHSLNCMSSYGCNNMVVIPHGCEPPTYLRPIHGRFTVGYLGAIGPDKGLIYLIMAWAKLNYKDAQLVIAGKASLQLMDMVRSYGRGSIFLAGYIDKISDFYNNISVYVQPSVTEGFGMEIVEAMAHGRPVICSDGVGAVDCVNQNTGMIFKKRSIDELANCINNYKHDNSLLLEHGGAAKNLARGYYWDDILQRYVKLWKDLIHV